MEDSADSGIRIKLILVGEDVKRNHLFTSFFVGFLEVKLPKSDGDSMSPELLSVGIHEVSFLRTFFFFNVLYTNYFGIFEKY